VLSAQAGLHRFVWDLHYPRPAVLRFSYPIAAIYRNTPVMPVGPWALPGRYTVKLSVDGTTITQPLTVKMDPRVKTLAAELERQSRLSMKLYELLRQDFAALAEVQAFRADARNVVLEGDAAGVESTLTRLNGQHGSLYRSVESADVAPTSQVVEAIGTLERALGDALAQWEELKSRGG